MAQLAEKIGATVLGDGSAVVAGCHTLEEAGPEQISFLANPRYAKLLATTRAASGQFMDWRGFD